MTVTVPSINETDLTKINRSIQQLASGRSNAYGIVTLAVSPATSTTVVDENCAASSVPLLEATTANAAAARATTYIPTATVSNGSFVIQHASSAQVDRTFLYALHG